MGSEFAELQKRPEKQQDSYAHRYAPKPRTKLAKPGKPPIRLAATYPEQRRVIDPENPGQYKIEGWTPEAQARYDDNPELAWLKDPNGKPPTPQEAVLMRKAKKRQQQSLAVTQSARVQGQGAVPQTPVEQFQHRLKDGAIHRLEQNKARLTQVQGTYQNTQTSNEQWKTLRTLANRDQQLKRLQDQTNQELMTLVAKKEFSNTLLGRLVNQTPLGKMLDLPKSDPIQNEFLLNVLGTSPQDVDPKYREQFTGLRSRLELLYSVRQEMRAIHPALAVVDTAEVSGTANTPEQNAKIYRQMSAGFDGMRSDMSKLSQTIEEDPSKALLFDALETKTLGTFKDPVERQQAKAWAQQQKDQDATMKAVLGVGTVGMAVGGAFAGPLGWGANVARGLFLGGAALGMGLAAYEFPQVMVMDLAALAGAAGGEKLTSQKPEEARMNLAMGYANLALAGLDLGLSAGLIGKVARLPRAVRSAAALTRQQSQVLINSVARHTGQLTDAALEKLLTAVKAADEKTTLIIVNDDMSLAKMRPLGQTADKLETTVAARASGKVKKPPKLFDDYLNAPTVKPFIGTKVDPNNLPSGYLYGKMPLENGKFREVIYMASSDGTKVPLKLDAKGFIKVGKEGEYRIVSKAAYDRNVVTVPGQPGKLLGGDSEVHHLLADNLLRGTPFGQRTLKLGAFNPDSGPNLIELANSLKSLEKARKAHPNVKFSDFIHNTQHKDFDGLMQEVVNLEIRDLRDAKGLSRMKREDFIQQMTKEEIKEVWDESLARMRRGLMNEDKALYKQIKTRPKSGSLAQGESQDNSEVA